MVRVALVDTVLLAALRWGVGLRLVLLCGCTLRGVRVVCVRLGLRVRPCASHCCVRAPSVRSSLTYLAHIAPGAVPRGRLYRASRHSYRPAVTRSSVAGPTSIALRFVPLPCPLSRYEVK